MLLFVYLFIYRMTQLPNFLYVHESVLLIFQTLNMLAYTKKSIQKVLVK